MSKKPLIGPEIRLTFFVGLGRLIDAMSELSHEDLFSLISQIDSLCADYDFTKKLADHFAAEIAKEDASS